MRDHIGNRDTLEVEDLTAAEDRRKHLVLLGRRHNEDGVARRLLKRLEEGVEGARRQHVHLVDDEDLVLSGRGRDVHLLAERADIVDAVVRRGVELDQVEGVALLDCDTRFALAAGLPFGSRMETIDCLRKDTGTRRLADAARSAEKVRLGQTARLDGVLEGMGQSRLTDDGIEGRGPVLAG